MAASKATGSVLNTLHVLLIRDLAFTTNRMPICPRITGLISCPGWAYSACPTYFTSSSPFAWKESNHSHPFSLPAYSPLTRLQLEVEKKYLHYAFPDACFKCISHSTSRWRRREVTISHEFQTKFWDKGHNAENFAITPFLKQRGLSKLHWVLP